MTFPWNGARDWNLKRENKHAANPAAVALSLSLSLQKQDPRSLNESANAWQSFFNVASSSTPAPPSDCTHQIYFLDQPTHPQGGHWIVKGLWKRRLTLEEEGGLHSNVGHKGALWLQCNPPRTPG